MKFKLAVVLIVLQYFIFSAGIVPTPTAHAEPVDSFFYETSFEDGDDQTWITDFTARDSSDKYTGSYSLKYTNDGTEPYVSKRLALKAGHTYDMSVWAKTIAAPDNWIGVKIGIDGYNDAAEWKSGQYMNQASTNGEWQLITLPAYTPTEDTTVANFALYSQGTGGTIWFDDIKIVETPPVPASEVFYETSFEDTEDLAFITDFTERDASDRHTGSYSLKYTNDGNKPVSYVRMPVKAGYAYDVSVWVKTAELTGQWAGARVAIDAYDQAGNWSFGKYMNPVNSEEEWQFVRLPTYVAGENVASAQFSLYSEGTGGTIWFDDLRITEKLFVEEDTNGNYETSFEDITDTTWDKSFTDYDTTEVNNGEYALKYTFNGSNPTVSVRIPVKAGYAYDATVWVKTADLTGMWAGARIAVDGYDENGGWKLGKYMDPMSSNGIWIQLRLPTYVADKGTVYADFALYSYGESGTIWFDDLKIVEYKPDPLIAKLVTPQYRGILMPDGNPIVTVATRGTVGLTAEDYTTTVKLVNADEETIEEQVWTEKLDTLTEFDTTALAAGDYEAVVTTYVTNKPEEAFVERFKIKKVSTVSELPKSYVDDYGRFWRDGELFFPIGIYTANIDESELQDLSDSPFNTIMPYDYPNLDQLHLAEQYGQKVIFSLKDFFYDFPYAPPFIEDEDDEVEAIALMAEQYRNHPALLAWYLSDETPTDKRLSTHYKTIVENDPNHPAYTVDYHIQDSYSIRHTSDLFGLDFYPLHGQPADDLSIIGNMQKTMTDSLGKMGQWPVVQAHNIRNYGTLDALRGPTTQEMRNMTWQYLAEGAKGILFYSLFDLKRDASGASYESLLENTKQVAKEVELMAPVILSEEAIPAIAHSTADGLRMMVKSYNDHVYLFAVNNSETAQQVTFTSEQFDNEAVRVWNENRNVTWVDGQFTDTFEPLAVHIYEIGTGAGIVEPALAQWANGSELSISQAAQSSVQLSWPDAWNAESYRIYKDGELIEEVTAETSTYLVAGLNSNTQYTFTVKAVNSLGYENAGLEQVIRTTSYSGGSYTTVPSDNTDLQQLNEEGNDEENDEEVEASASHFTDIQSHWAQSAIERLYREQMINGYPDGQFKPERFVTRAEFIVMLMNALKSDVSVSELDFTDDRQIAEWARSAIGKAISAGIVSGYPDGSFQPNQTMTRVEMIEILTRALQLQVNTETVLPFVDLDQIPSWAIQSVQSVYQQGLIQGKTGGFLAPLDTLTRAEAAVILTRILDWQSE